MAKSKKREPLVLIGCPVQNRAEVIQEYLDAIYNLDYPHDRIVLFFYVNNSSDDTFNIIQDFIKKHRGEYFYAYVVKDTVLKGRQDDQSRTKSRDYSLFVVVRNKFLRRLRNLPNYDYLFSVDSDIILPPDSLRKLLENKKDVCSALVQNTSFHGWTFYNVLFTKDWEHYDNLVWNGKDFVILVCNGKDPCEEQKYVMDKERFRVDATGACVLIHRDVIKDGVRYEYHPQGEDMPFCRNCQDRGFTLWCDPRVRPKHLLTGRSKS